MNLTTSDATRESIANRAARLFEERYGGPPEVVAVCPGRINIIGEHVDYAGGLCLPAAAGRYLAVAAAAGGEISLVSELFPGDAVEADPANIRPTGRWADHALGTLAQLAAEGGPAGLRAAIASDIPPGSGLSSSAAVSIAMGIAAARLEGREFAPYDLARLSRRSENQFLGVPSGLMDQVACTMGRADNAVLFHADTEIAELVPVPAEAAWLVVRSGIDRSLRGTAYADRPAEAGRALDLARRRHRGLRSLAELDPAEVEELQLPAPLDRRARHIAGESLRTRLAVACLEARNLDALGQLISTSHRSLVRDCEVSLPELDRLVDVMMEAGCLGARLMGAGFGGSVIGLVPAAMVEEASEVIAERFRRDPAASPGAGEILNLRIVDGALPPL